MTRLIQDLLRSIRAIGNTSTSQRKATSTRSFPRLEPLDPRDVPATLIWVGADGGDWSDASNWSGVTPARAPTTGDQLDFGELGGSNTSSKDDIANLSVSEIDQSNTFAGEIDIESGSSLTVTGSFTAYGDVKIESGGQLTAGTVFQYGALDVTGNGPPGSDGAVVASTIWMEPGASLDTSASTGAIQVGLLSVSSGTTWDSHGNIMVTGNVSAGGDISLDSSTSMTVTGYFNMGWTGTLDLPNGSALTAESTSQPLELDGTTDVTGGVTITAANIRMEGQADMDISGAGTGLTINGNLDEASGTIDLRDSGGGLFISGNFSQSSTGTLSVDIDYSSFGKYISTGSAALEGNLEISATGTKPPNWSFGLISAPFGRTGDFAEVEAPEDMKYGWLQGMPEYQLS